MQFMRETRPENLTIAQFITSSESTNDKMHFHKLNSRLMGYAIQSGHAEVDKRLETIWICIIY